MKFHEFTIARLTHAGLRHAPDNAPRLVEFFTKTVDLDRPFELIDVRR